MSKTTTAPAAIVLPAPSIATLGTINKNELICHLADLKRGQFVTIQAQTPVSSISAKSIFKGVLKLATVRFQWGIEWQKKVQKDNAEFQKGERQWGDALETHKTQFVKHEKDGVLKEYISVVDGETINADYFFPDGKPLTLAQVKEMYENHMIPSYHTAKAKEAARQGVSEDDRHTFNNYTVSNIKTANFGGGQYIIR